MSSTQGSTRSGVSCSDVSDPCYISVRLVTMDHYMAPPIHADLDPVYSSFRSSVVERVPVLRVFGPTVAGQKTCLHIHGILPYMYVPKPADAANDSFIYQLAASIDKALNISTFSAAAAAATTNDEGGGNRKTHSGQQHVFKIVEVKGRPFYGYHEKEHEFFKIYFYNPWMVKRAAEMLQSGAIMGKVLQPHYSHVPYNLQFMMDYNLQGMNFIRLSHCLFRKSAHSNFPPTPIPGSQEALHLNDDPELRLFYEHLLPPEAFLDPDSIRRDSTTELEIDAVAADILNSNQDLMQLSNSSVLHSSANQNASIFRSGKKLTNPGLEALWEDERNRRLEMEIEDSSERLSPPSSPPRNEGRGADFESHSQKFWAQRFSEIVAKLKAVETPSEKDDVNTNQQVTDEAADQRVYAAVAPDDSMLPDATTVEDHVASLSSQNSMLLLSSSGGSSFSRQQRHRRHSAAAERRLQRQRRLSKEEEAKKRTLFDQTVVDEDLLSQALSAAGKSDAGQRPGTDDEDDLIELLKELGDEKDADDQADEEQVRASASLSSSPPPPSQQQQKQQQRSQSSWFLDDLDDHEMSQICLDTDPFLLLDPEFEEIEAQLRAASVAAAAGVSSRSGSLKDKRDNQKQSFNATINWNTTVANASTGGAAGPSHLTMTEDQTVYSSSDESETNIISDNVAIESSKAE